MNLRGEGSQSLTAALSASGSSSRASVDSGTYLESSGPVEHGLVDELVELQAAVVDDAGSGALGDHDGPPGRAGDARQFAV